MARKTYTQWQWRNRGSHRDWEDIAKPEVFWLQMEYRRVRRRVTQPVAAA